MYRSRLEDRRARRRASDADELTVALAFLFAVCALRTLQGVLLEPRLGGETSLSALVAAWTLRESIQRSRPRR